MNTFKKTILCGSLALGLTACVTNFAPGIYTPQLSEDINGMVNVSTFTSNQPELSAKSKRANLGYDMNTWLSEFFTDAVSQELMQMEAYDENAKCTISGEVTEYDWNKTATKINVSYVLSKGSKIIFTKDTQSQRALNSGMQLQVAQTMLHRIMTDSVAQLVRTDSFQSKMRRYCK